jgi:CBS domain-containing protein
MDQAPDAQAWLAEAAIRRRPPLGFLRAQVVEKDGRCGQRFHLEESGLGLIANAVRPLALAHRIDDTNTLVRLTRLAQMGVIPDRLAADLREAFGFLTILKVSKCLETPEVLCGEVNDIEVCDLNTVQRKMLKESFAVIDQLQELVRTLYQEAPVAAAGNHG